ncbi:transglutaminase domain protein [Beutenbergia cavernae DSM 12333]|uniref:Transglutaminase domain protein n=1 Tax=Beutenbergia cavernae (strain ATCC BAA-8 / DSM 12333 / CCUG 43141 / JCM 11478 / NBRC 16432 / NCIMB 13614 / HKI 0122) TaxID=471853 RepID=C5C4P0_BEUC1|nr:transglutaminase-like domain-containing protein [Beutenbergia cavernae]ACQ80018.1 transglutaminase domain protein [Beutenbergia cavernae DSM 12333]
MTAAAAPTTRAAGRSSTRAASWWTAARAADVAVPVLLVLLALVPLWPVYLTGSALAAGIGGVALGAGVAVAGAWRRWPTLVVVAVALVVVLATSGLAAPDTAIAGIVPTPDTWQAFGVGIVQAWKQVLTLLPPLGASGFTLVVPYALGFTAALVAVTIALRARRGATFAVVPPAVVGLIAILFGTTQTVLPVVVGVLAVVVGLGWTTWRAGRLQPGRAPAVATLALVGALGAGVGVLGGPGDADRFVLRDVVVPPPLEHDYPSPLAGFRAYLKLHEEETMFTFDGVEPGAVVRLATLDSYDGTVWDVTADGAPGGGEFRRATDRFVTELDPDATGIGVRIGAYDGVWIPTIGDVEDLDFTDVDAAALADGLYVNRTTGTVLTTEGLGEDDAYRLTTVPRAATTAEELDGQPIADIQMPTAQNFPDLIGSVAGRLVEGATTDVDRARALADGLAHEGYFSHGLEGDAPSEAGHGYARLATLLGEEEMIGDEEQYAATMALMARSLGWPSRVVLGFERPEGESGEEWAVQGGDVTAWVEIPFEGVGWVAFDPTPDEDNVPQSEDPSPQDRPQPQVLQPPPPPVAAPDVPTQDRDEVDVEDSSPDRESVLSNVLGYVAAIGIPLLVVVAPFVVVAVLKARRRRRRRSHGEGTQRIAGGWSELMDNATDLGHRSRSVMTRSEHARGLSTRFGEASGGTVALAHRADAGVFAPTEPDPVEVEAFWADVDSAVTRLRTGVPWHRRIRSRVSVRSLRRSGR